MKRILLFLLAIFLISGCASTKKVPKGDYLLRKNVVSLNYADSIDKKYKIDDVYALENFIPTSQRPNKRILGLPFYLNAYNLIDTTKSNWFQNIFKKIGEEPIIYNAEITKKTVSEMEMFMQSSGFYSATVADTVIFKKNKAFINYTVESGLPTLISSINYNIKEESLRDTILSDTINSILKVGTPLSRYDINIERARIADYIENLGYYGYSLNNITFLVDTLDKHRTADMTINIDNSSSFTANSTAKKYKLRNIYINSSFSTTEHDKTNYDTTYYNGIYIIKKKGEHQNIKPRILAEILSLSPGKTYSKKEVDYTSSNLMNLRYFKNVNIHFNKVDSSKNDTKDTEEANNADYIDCQIDCTPMKRQSFKFNSELSSNANYTGLSLSFGYANKNLFRGADMFDASFTTSYDIMHSREKKNSYEYGFSTSLTLPRFISPFKLSKNKQLPRVQTRIELSYSDQYRPFYRRKLSNAAFGYQWEKKKSFYIVKPLNVAYVNVPWIDPDFWNNIENKYLQNSYTSQLIFGMAGTYNYNDASENKLIGNTLKINAETSGNFLNLMSVILNSPYRGDAGDRYRNAFSVRYSQYIRSDISYVLNRKINERGALVFRGFAGAGYAYNNTKSLPFERMFFVGGASSMRGWQVRTLGAGTTPEKKDDYPEQVGNIRLEANLEGRFHVLGPLNGAVFLDCGNIWINGEGLDNTDTKLTLQNLPKQLALNTGIGARFDFDFFILRLDWGIILRNPGWEEGQRWIRNFNLRNTAVHFGIGYPF